MRPDRRQVLFIAEAVTLAHVARAVVLARALDPERFEVHGAWDPRHNALLGDLPVVYHPIRSLPTAEFLKRLRHARPMHDTATLRDYVKEDLTTIERVKPDVIVGDFRLSLAASARIAGVPLVATANAYWSPFGRQDFIFPAYDYPLRRVVGRRLSVRLFRMFRRVGFAMHTRPLNIVLRECGLPGIGGDIRTMYTFGDYTAYADIPELVPVEGLPPNHRYLGAVLWSPSVPTPPWWDALPNDKPIVYVTLGSSGEGEILPVVLDALAGLPVTSIVATAGRYRLAAIPSNAHLAEYLPGTQAAARASLVVCNGGSPTSSQALAAGAPVLGLSGTNMDQHLNMEAVQRAGAGLVLRPRGLTSAALRSTVEELLGRPGYRQAAGRLAEAHQRCHAPSRFASLIGEITGV